jgi:hypothetical protein
MVIKPVDIVAERTAFTSGVESFENLRFPDDPGALGLFRL